MTERQIEDILMEHFSGFKKCNYSDKSDCLSRIMELHDGDMKKAESMAVHRLIISIIILITAVFFGTFVGNL